MCAPAVCLIPYIVLGQFAVSWLRDERAKGEVVLSITVQCTQMPTKHTTLEKVVLSIPNHKKKSEGGGKAPLVAKERWRVAVSGFVKTTLGM